MSKTIRPAQPSALARSAARQLNRPVHDHCSTGSSAELKLRDVAELPRRDAVLHTARVVADAQGPVARAMARQSGVSLEQLRHNTDRAAMAAAQLAAARGVDSNSLSPHSAQDQPPADNAIGQHTATANCNAQNLLAMCADLQDSLALPGQLAGQLAGQLLLDALIVRLVARCLSLHPTLCAAPSASHSDHNDALNIAISMRIDEQWQMPTLRNVKHLGIASLAQHMGALSIAASGQTLSDDADTASHLGVFSVLNSPVQMHDTLHAAVACGASLRITPALDASCTVGEHSASVGGGERLIELTVYADARLSDAATCATFLDDLAAMFVEPRRALL